MSQGNNFFSDILVSFEETVETHSHQIALATMKIPPNALSMKLVDLQTEQNKSSIRISIQNQLPHNLPTGTFGSKKIILCFSLHRTGTIVSHDSITVTDEENALPPHTGKTVTITINKPLLDGDIITLRLERSSLDNQLSPVILSTGDFPLSL